MDHATLKERTIEQQQRRQAEYEVSRFGDEISIDGMKLSLVDDFKEAFSEDGLTLRYTPLLKQYDYIVGDLSAGQLRLRGFYHEERSVSADQKINTLADYLYETVNFGAPYFILKNETVSFRPTKIRDYLTEWEQEQKQRQKTNQKKQKPAGKKDKRPGKTVERSNRQQKRTGQKPTNNQNNNHKKRRHRFTEKKRDGQATAQSQAVKKGQGNSSNNKKRPNNQSAVKKNSSENNPQHSKKRQKVSPNGKKRDRSFTIKERQ